MTEPIKSDGEALPESKTETPQARWKRLHPKEVWAQHAMRSAVKRGLLVPGPCEVCGTEPADGHHDDYDRPMEVRWLCRQHHRQEHAKAKSGGEASPDKEHSDLYPRPPSDCVRNGSEQKVEATPKG